MTTIMTLRIATFTLQALGFILLALLLFTIQITSGNGRHPLFINFLVTWVMYSAFVTYDFLIVFTIPQLEQLAPGYTTVIGTQYDIFVIIINFKSCNPHVDHNLEWSEAQSQLFG